MKLLTTNIGMNRIVPKLIDFIILHAKSQDWQTVSGGFGRYEWEVQILK